MFCHLSPKPENPTDLWDKWVASADITNNWDLTAKFKYNASVSVKNSIKKSILDQWYFCSIAQNNQRNVNYIFNNTILEYSDYGLKDWAANCFKFFRVKYIEE